MAMEIIIKPSSLVDSENILTLAQRKVLNVLLEHSRQIIHETDMYSLSVKTIKEKAGDSYFQSNSDVFEQIKAIVDLPPIEANIFGKDKKYPTRVVVNLLAQAVYDKDNEVVSWEYPSFIREMLKRYNTIDASELGMYVKLPLSVQAQFSSKHALALWEFCRSRFDEKRGFAESPFISIEDLNKLFHTNYDSWYRLNEHIIRKAIQDIHKHEPTYFISLREQKVKHKVVAVKFIIQHRNYEQPLVLTTGKKTKQEKLFQGDRPPAIDPKKNAIVERYLATLSPEQQSRIMEEAEQKIPDFMAFPTTEQDHTAYQLLLQLTRNSIVESILNVSGDEAL